MPPSGNLLVELMHAKVEEALNSVKRASEAFAGFLTATNRINSLLKKVEDTATELTNSLVHDAEAGTDDMDMYRKLLHEMRVVERACHDVASMLVKTAAALQTSESIEGPVANLFTES